MGQARVWIAAAVAGIASVPALLALPTESLSLATLPVTMLSAYAGGPRGAFAAAIWTVVMSAIRLVAVPSTIPAELLAETGEALIVALGAGILTAKLFSRTQSLQMIRREMDAAFEAIGDAIALFDVMDGKAQYRLGNTAYAKMTGQTTSDIRGRTPREVYGEDPGAEIERYLGECIASRTLVHYRVGRTHLQRPVMKDVLLSPVISGGRVTSIISASRDISDLERAQAEVRALEGRLRQIADHTSDIVFHMNVYPRNSFNYISPSVQSRLGYSPDDFYQNPDLAKGLINPEDYDHLQVLLSGQQTTGAPVVTRWLHKDGHSVWLEISVTATRDLSGNLTVVQGIARDVTERVTLEKEIEYRNTFDPLTGLHNRTYYDQQLRQLETTPPCPITVMSMDVNGLKLVNDLFGQERGDEILSAFAVILKSCFRETDIVARIGSDNFMAILPATGLSAAQAILRQIRSGIAQHNASHPTAQINVAFGMAMAACASDSLNATIRAADENMFRDKLQAHMGSRGAVDVLLAALAAKDFVSEGHVERVKEMAGALADALALSETVKADVMLLSEIHDLGKVSMPDEILFKPESLTAEEYEQMKQHSAIGYRIARSSPQLAHVANAILYHHERWDGNGYPAGLKGEAIPVESRIVAVCDAFDAMTHDRQYSTARSEEDAIQELIRGAGSQFDPHIVNVFVSLRRGEPQLQM